MPLPQHVSYTRRLYMYHMSLHTFSSPCRTPATKAFFQQQTFTGHNMTKQHAPIKPPQKTGNSERQLRGSAVKNAECKFLSNKETFV